MKGEWKRAASNLVAQERAREKAGKLRPEDNDPVAISAKIDIRRRVLEEHPDARVLDLFCGTGAMWRAVWSQAKTYVGCDARPLAMTDPPRFVADNRRLMRCLDLDQYDTFDLDAWGSPWEQLEILMHRRQWSSGERGALVVTDGSTASARFRPGGSLPEPVARIAGISSAPRTSNGAEGLFDFAVGRWMERCRVRPERAWRSRRPASRKGRAGGTDVIYAGIVFRGA